MRVIISGGGTGGHIYPAIAIADKIKRKNRSAEILFVGTKRGMEKDIVPKYGYDIRFISASGFNRKKIHKNIFTIRDFIKGSIEAKKIIEEFNPDIVIGTGGYVCAPVIREAYKCGVKAFIHEQNAIPGITNKFLEKYVEKVFISFEETAKYFKESSKLVYSGNPIRRSFLLAGFKDYRKELGLSSKDFVVLCFGGSLGAKKINSVMEELIASLYKAPNFKLYFVTGKYYYNNIADNLAKRNIDLGNNIHIFPYLDNIHEYYFASDLIISRAGALTVSEITASGRPSILIPSPNVTGNHQFFNAKVVADKGGAVLIEEKNLTPEKLEATILRLMNNREALNRMADASSSIGKSDGVDVIYDHLGI
ncbi:MAG: undecaprenyldiphospho-muramoylpentapeptide beta-N-acetylglucosaminyltransferase [Clostridiales bacterium]|jgi:UDP-N-acetylglucosamine--N-acetylmuramyl-(pentapeptide) pyrophosphoryl-undecaprenol N-acetylglucosamine transferase|nr:undecaprenyldiphospho-muramoylpentapeptide beta-N-acetylglucosaminyltransferase [Clostridiales bacterium]